MAKNTVYHQGASKQRVFIPYPCSYALSWWLFGISSFALQWDPRTETESQQKQLRNICLLGIHKTVKKDHPLATNVFAFFDAFRK